jgi:hypothetical protein
VVQHDKHVAEITHLLTRAAGWPAGLRWIVRRTRPSRRQAKNLTAFEKAAGWRYSIIVTNIPAAHGIGGVPGSRHAQFIDVLHCQHAVVEDGVRTAKSMGLRNLPSEDLAGELRVGASRQHRRGPGRLVPAARPVRLRRPQGRRAGHAALPAAEPARPAGHARARVLKLSRIWPWKDAFLACWQRLCALPEPT